MNAMRCSVKRSSSPEPECTAIGAPGAAVARCPRKGRLPLAATAIGAPGAAAAHCPRRGRLPLAVAVNGHRAAPPLPASLAKERCNHDPPLPARWACSGLPVVSAVASVRWRAAHDRPPTSLPKWLCRAQSPLAVPRAAPASGAGPRATAVPVAARSRADRQSRPPPSAPSDPRPAPACAQPASPAREPRRPTTASPRACSCRSPAPPATAAAPFSESCTAAPGAAGGAGAGTDVAGTASAQTGVAGGRLPVHFWTHRTANGPTHLKAAIWQVPPHGMQTAFSMGQSWGLTSACRTPVPRRGRLGSSGQPAAAGAGARSRHDERSTNGQSATEFRIRPYRRPGLR